MGRVPASFLCTCSAIGPFVTVDGNTITGWGASAELRQRYVQATSCYSGVGTLLALPAPRESAN